MTFVDLKTNECDLKTSAEVAEATKKNREHYLKTEAPLKLKNEIAAL